MTQQPFNVLVVSNNNLLDESKLPDELSKGQLGLFVKDTGKSIKQQNFFTKLNFGVGLGSGKFLLTDIDTSDSLQLQSINVQTKVNKTDLIIGIDNKQDFVKDKTFSFSLEYSDTSLVRVLGRQRFHRFFSVEIPSQVVSSVDISQDDVATLIAKELNKSSKGLFKADKDTNNQKIKLTFNQDYGIPYASIKLDQGFGPSAVVSVTQAVVPQTSGKFVQELEHKALGYNFGVNYRTSAITGTTADGVVTYADPEKDYVLVTFKFIAGVEDSQFDTTNTTILAIESTVFETLKESLKKIDNQYSNYFN